MNKIRTLLVTISLIVILGIIAYHNQTKPRVLVIHSYNTDFSWVNDVNGGIKQYIAKAGGTASRVIIRYHYMDLRNHKTCEFYRSAINDAKLVIQDFKPQVIIIVDDIGQDLIGSQYLNFKEGTDANKIYDAIAKKTADRDCKDKFATPQEARDFFNLNPAASLSVNPTVIFAGVNGDVDKYGYYQATNVAGIFERKNFVAIYQTIEDLYRASPDGHKPKAVQILSDNSSTGLAELPLFETLRGLEFTVPLEWKECQVAKTPDEWKAIVAQANQDQAILLVANYGGMKGQQADIIKWTESEAAYPMLGAATDFINDGGMLTFAVPGYEQGQVSIMLAIKLFENYSVRGLLEFCSADKMMNNAMLPEPKPFCSAKQFLVGMNQSMVNKRQLDLPLIYESFSRQSGNFRDK